MMMMNRPLTPLPLISEAKRMVQHTISRVDLKEGAYNLIFDNNFKYIDANTDCNIISPAVIALIAELMQEEYRFDKDK